MKKSLTIGLSALALVGGGSAALAMHHGGGMKADANGDGVVTRAEAEAEAGATAMFAKMDANNDGTLNAADREARKQARRTKMFAALDADNNGQISRDEFMNHEHEGKRGKGHKMGKRGHRGGKMMLRMADTDKDGNISQAEFTAAAMSRFDKTDANNDGQVTAEERQAHREQMRAKWHEKKHGNGAS